MRARSVAVAALCLLVPLARTSAQRPGESFRWPLLAGAVSTGALGFTDRNEPRPLLAAYGYAAFPRLIIGVNGGRTLGPGAPDAAYGMGSLGYPARAIRESLVYPFVSAGLGTLHGTRREDGVHALYGAGVGADRVIGDGVNGLLVGLRGGYVFRSQDAGTRAVYVALSIGAAGRPGREAPPPVIVALR